MMKKHILILGGTGFLGSNLKKKLNQNQNLNIQSISSKEIDLTKQDSYSKLVNFYEEASTIIFLSAVKRNLGDTYETYEKNTQICINVSKALKIKPIRNLIYLSSCAVYGEKNNQIQFTETSELNPTSFYGASKISNENLISLMKNENKIKILTILRPTTIYGDINISTYCPSGFIGKALKNKKIELWGDGTEKRDFFYIEDFVAVIELLINNPTNTILNLVTGKSISFLDLSDYISKYNDNLVITMKERTNNMVNHSYNSEKLNKFMPIFKFQDPISWIEKFYKNRNL